MQTQTSKTTMHLPEQEEGGGIPDTLVLILLFILGGGTLKDIKKVKVKLSLCLTKHHAMKTYWRSGGTVSLIP
jgi:hypothetical protein